MDPYYAPLDDGDVGVFDRGNLPRCALGLRCAGMGRLLGMGSGGERVTSSLAHRHGVPAFGNDAGKARHAEDVECVADFLNIYAFHSWDASYAQRTGEFRSRVCAVFDWKLVRHFPGDHFCGLFCHLYFEPVASGE